MSLHPWGLVVFVFLTLVLILLFAAGLCERELRNQEAQNHPPKNRRPAASMR
jgi:hypothetical protein